MKALNSVTVCSAPGQAKDHFDNPESTAQQHNVTDQYVAGYHYYGDAAEDESSASDGSVDRPEPCPYATDLLSIPEQRRRTLLRGKMRMSGGAFGSGTEEKRTVSFRILYCRARIASMEVLTGTRSPLPGRAAEGEQKQYLWKTSGLVKG